MKSTEELLEELVREKSRHISLLEFKVDVFEEKCKVLEDENKQLKKDKYDLEQEILLYELGQDVKELEGLLDRLEEAGDSEATEEVKEIKATVEKLIQSKSEGLIAVVRANEMMIENIEAERKRLADLKVKKQARIDSIKKYALECMQAMEVKKIETHLGNMTVRKGTGKVVVDDPTKAMTIYE